MRSEFARLQPLLSLLLLFTAIAQAEDPDLPRLLKHHCVECHNDQTAEGGLNLQKLPWSLSDSANRERWEQIHDRIERHEMPPDPNQIPDNQRAELQRILNGPIHQADLNSIRTAGRGPSRRLNRDEFEQNLRDLLLLPQLDVRDLLPEDREAHHFTKTTAVLEMSRVQLTGYLDAAEAALNQAIASGVEPPATERFHALATKMFAEAETFGNREAMFYARDSKWLPLDGGKLNELRRTGQHDPQVEMALFRAASWPYYGYPDGFVVRLSGNYKVRFSARAVVQIAGFELKPATRPQPMTFRARAPSGPDVSGDVRATGGILDVSPEVGIHETVISLRKGETFEYSLLGLPMPLARNVDNGPPTYRYPPFPEGGQPGVAFGWIEVTGPLAPSTWPPPSHRVLFDDLPIRQRPGTTPGTNTSGASNQLPVEVVSQSPKQDALRLIRRFAHRAAQRPIAEESLQPFEHLVLDRLDRGASLTEALFAGYQAFLCSPHFLYLDEPRPGEDQFPIAARLSHLLTNSRPDESLAQQAHDRKLRDPIVLKAEADRLIDSPGFSRFIRSFTDSWLALRQIRRDDPDHRLYPEYRFDDYLVESMELETRAFVTEMIRGNQSATVLIDSDFLFANDRLATHYGLPPLPGSALRKVPRPEGSPYGGLLTQAALLKVTANGTTTSPVVRGAWVMDRLLGEPAPPPPASVPAVEPDIRGAKTIRELLSLHTRSESCARCHQRFDPVGMALENFDILGGWRVRYRGLEQGDRVTGIDRAGHDFSYTLAEPVDAAGQVRDGRRFQNVRDIKSLLMSNPRQLARNLLAQFTVYSTGTPVRFSDRAQMERILDACAPDGYRVRDLLHGLIQSEVFLGPMEASKP